MKIPILVVAAALATVSAAAQAANAPVGITRAVAVAEKETGARAMDAELDTASDGRLIYEITLGSPRSLHEVEVDAHSGKVLGKRSPRIASYWARWFGGERMRAVSRGKPLAELLGDLERRSGGRVHEVSFEVENGRPRYEVEIETVAGIADIYLDPKSGRRLSLVGDD